VLLLELVGHVVDDALVEVVATQEGIAVGAADLKHAVADVQDRDVKGAAAQIVDGDRLILLLAQAISQAGGRRLVDDTLDIQAGDPAGVLGGVALGVVEVGRDGDHGLGDRLAQVSLGVRLDLLQDHGGDFRRAVRLAAHVDAHIAVRRSGYLVRHQADGPLHLGVGELATHKALDGEDGVLRVNDSLVAGNRPDQALALVADGHDGGDQPPAFRRGDNRGFAAFHHGDHRVGGTQIDTDDLTHS